MAYDHRGVGLYQFLIKKLKKEEEKIIKNIYSFLSPCLSVRNYPMFLTNRSDMHYSCLVKNGLHYDKNDKNPTIDQYPMPMYANVEQPIDLNDDEAVLNEGKRYGSGKEIFSSAREFQYAGAHENLTQLQIKQLRFLQVTNLGLDRRLYSIVYNNKLIKFSSSGCESLKNIWNRASAFGDVEYFNGPCEMVYDFSRSSHLREESVIPERAREIKNTFDRINSERPLVNRKFCNLIIKNSERNFVYWVHQIDAFTAEVTKCHYFDTPYDCCSSVLSKLRETITEESIIKNIFSYLSPCCAEGGVYHTNSSKKIPYELTESGHHYNNFGWSKVQDYFPMPLYGKSDLADEIIKDFGFGDVNSLKFIMDHPRCSKNTVEDRFGLSLKRNQVELVKKIYRSLISDERYNIPKKLLAKKDNYMRLLLNGRSDEIIKTFEKNRADKKAVAEAKAILAYDPHNVGCLLPSVSKFYQLSHDPSEPIILDFKEKYETEMERVKKMQEKLSKKAEILEKGLELDGYCYLDNEKLCGFSKIRVAEDIVLQHYDFKNKSTKQYNDWIEGTKVKMYRVVKRKKIRDLNIRTRNKKRDTNEVNKLIEISKEKMVDQRLKEIVHASKIMDIIRQRIYPYDPNRIKGMRGSRSSHRSGRGRTSMRPRVNKIWKGLFNKVKEYRDSISTNFDYNPPPMIALILPDIETRSLKIVKEYKIMTSIYKLEEEIKLKREKEKDKVIRGLHSLQSDTDLLEGIEVNDEAINIFENEQHKSDY